MQYVRLGSKGPTVSRVGFGAWAIGGVNWGPTDDEVSRQALLSAFQCGVTFVDTADVYGYGHSEELVAGVLREFGRDEIIVATKAGNDFYNATAADETGYGRIRLSESRDYLVWAAEQSLRRLDCEVLDILQLHSLTTEQLKSDEPWEALATLKRQGKIRWAGWSITSYRETEQARFLEKYHELIDCIQVRYNLLERKAERVLFPLAQQYGIGVIVRIPLLFGVLTGKFDREARFDSEDHRSFNLSRDRLDDYLTELELQQELFNRYPEQSPAQVSLRFCLTHPACHTVIPGAKTPQQALENAAVGDLGPLETRGDDGSI
ncbi:MAG: aldo/keto reductase [Acidobacteriota bacterium]|nr:MAG: aldo/keto reductase [Acidobacteriota bacterium]